MGIQWTGQARSGREGHGTQVIGIDGTGMARSGLVYRTGSEHSGVDWKCPAWTGKDVTGRQRKGLV